MGQSQIKELQPKIQSFLQENPQQEIKWVPPEVLVAKILSQVNQISNKSVNSLDIQQHFLNYLNMQVSEKDNQPRRRRSYELIKAEQKTIEEPISVHNDLNQQHKILQEKMQGLEEIQEEIRTNITQLMATQKPYKIRQTFRKLTLKLLNIDNLLIYISHSKGKLQFHDFANNYITEVIEEERIKLLEKIITLQQLEDQTPLVLDFFDLVQEAEGKSELFKWSLSQENSKYNICYIWKSHENEAPKRINNRLIQKIASIAMLSSNEQQQSSIIQNYSKDLLQILELVINDCEISTSTELGFGPISMQDAQRDLIRKNCKDEMLMIRLNVYQQLQFQLLERIRMYKKYVCECDKIFMEFDQNAELTFISRNFQHPYVSQMPKLWQKKQLFLEKIFIDNKPINQFLKKAAQQKVKPNRLYELDFESKIRVKYNDGKIIKLHIIIEELQNHSSGSSSNIYTSSTKVISEESDNISFKNIEEQLQTRPRKTSTLVRNLQKSNPGITNQGWINLFIKDDQLTDPRTNTYFKTKTNKTYSAKRSVSFNHQSINNISEDSQSISKRIHGINIESIDLNMLQFQEELLEPLVLKVFRRLQFYHSEHINKEYFGNFLADVHNGYQIHNNPFHNFTHGVNVMHTCYLLASSARNKQILSPSKIFTIVFSGLCHDIGHTGFTNLFEIASGSKKAITYNDNSPLQNFHAAYTFQLLKKPQNNFLKDLSREQMKQFRQTVIKNILFTDIKEHFPLLEKFNKLIKNQYPKNDEYVNILSTMIVHTADFGGSAKQFEICKAWSLKVNLQFSNQYKRQGELGLPQTPFMKDLTNIRTLSKNQGGFLKVIVFPLYEAMNQFSGTDMKVNHLRQYVESNIKRWNKIHLQSEPEPLEEKQ